MRDRQVFDLYPMTNGTKLLHYPTDEGVATAQIVVPIGHVHNIGMIRRGSAHFLEHILCGRSGLHRKFNEFNQLVGMHGGELNAVTKLTTTDFFFTVPSRLFPELWTGLFACAFDPLITAEDIDRQRDVIRSERDQSYYYPGNNRVSQFIYSKWLIAQDLPLEQILGSDEDLDQMSEDDLKKLCGFYSDPGVYVLSAGNIDPEVVAESLESLKTKRHNLPGSARSPRWGLDERFVVEKFEDIKRLSYMAAAIVLRPSEVRTIRAIQFIVSYLINVVHGPLYDWLRHERSWAYSVSGDVEVYPDKLVWMFEVPLPNREALDMMRAELYVRAKNALQDNERISREIERQLDCALFQYEHRRQILGAASRDIDHFGRVVSESEDAEYLKSFEGGEFLRKVFDMYFAPELIREFCAIPK